MSCTCPVPVIDFSACKLGTVPCPGTEEYGKLVQEIYSAFSTIGFVYLKNHGIPEELIKQAFETSSEFFHLSPEEKEKYTRLPGLKNHGWCQIGRERFHADKPGDYKEAYDVNPSVAKSWPPDSTVNGFQDVTLQMYNICRQLSFRLLDVMAVGLALDHSFFSSRHNVNRQTYTALRCLYYPAIQHETGKGTIIDLEKNQQRCGEHTDYGSLTILFQDDVGGLEVFHRDQGFVPAPHIPGTVLVNLGDLMQRWTADKLLSTKHRVVNPVLNGKAARSRQSMVCFVHPDEDCLVECVDGSNKYPPITAKDYIDRRFNETFQY